jgi:hypothetical protein
MITSGQCASAGTTCVAPRGLVFGGRLAGSVTRVVDMLPSPVGVPAGDVGRLFYNLITPYFIADVPSVKQLRELFLILAAKENHPELKTKPASFLNEADIRTLEKDAHSLTSEQIEEYFERIDDKDLQAMVFIAKMRKIDAQVTNFLNILTSAGKVSGLTDDPGILRDIFNNPYFSLNGDLNIKTILSVALGHKETTPLSGVSLENLVHGNGPASAWLQFFEVSVDIRALINTLGGLILAQVGIIMYNYFVTRVDSYNYMMDETVHEILMLLGRREKKFVG